MYQVQERWAHDSGTKIQSVDSKLVVESEICSPRATFKLLIPRLNSFAIAHPTAKLKTGSQFKMDQSTSSGG